MGIGVKTVDSPEIILYASDKGTADSQQKWNMYSRYIFRGSDLLKKNTASDIPLKPAKTEEALTETLTTDIRTNSTPNLEEPTNGSPTSDMQSGTYMPDRIRSMLALYEFGDGSFRAKCRNFVKQGKLMEDYEDDAPWYGNLMGYFPVYHDLNIRQLRGYFTWRAGIRKGAFTRTCPAFAYIYVYELLNGIGARDPEDALDKLLVFCRGYIDTGMGGAVLSGDVRRWLFEFAVIHGFPQETALRFTDKGILDRDHALAVLADPAEYNDEEVFQALRRFSSQKTALSTVIQKDRACGIRLFAGIWRHIRAMKAKLADLWRGDYGPDCVIASQSAQEEADIFTLCFGRKELRPWRPLANAVYLPQDEDASTLHNEPESDGPQAGSSGLRTEGAGFRLDECRRYISRGGEWQVETYNSMSGDREAFLALMHAADRRLRSLLKTGHYLRQKQGDEWALPYVDAALKEIRAEEIEASKPRISIDLSGLDKIREDAGITRDSLLTDDEIDPGEHDSSIGTDCASTGQIGADAHADTASTGKHGSDDEADGASMNRIDLDGGAAAASTIERSDASREQRAAFGLDEIHTTIIRELLAGGTGEVLMAENHLMPEVAADTINEALFDEIGDSVVECTGAGLQIIEDYMEDLAGLTGGTYNE